MHYRAGNEEAAAASVHGLFATTRTLLAEHPRATRFEEVALGLLNNTLRPYTARWHGWMKPVSGMVDERGRPVRQFRDPLVRRQFRAELKDLSGTLRDCYVDLLDTLSREEDPAELLAEFRKHVASGAGRADADLGMVEAAFRRDVRLRHVAQGDGDLGEDIANDIQAAEHRYIAKRRVELGRAGDDRAAAAGELSPGWTSGLAFSGGGIRAATYSLGIVQVLQRQGLFREFDYMSTVSGGGYLGAFLSASLGHTESEDANQRLADTLGSPGVAEANRRESETAADDPAVTIPAPAQPTPAPAAAEPELSEPTLAKTALSEPVAIRHLRNSSKYLLNGGGWAKLRIVGLLITGFLASLMMLMTLPVVAVWGLVVIDRRGFFQPVGRQFLWWTFEGSLAQVLCVGAALLLSLSWLIMFVVQRAGHGARPGTAPARLRAWVEQATLIFAVATVATAVVLFVPTAVRGYEWLRDTVIFGLGATPGADPSAENASPRPWSLEWMIVAVSGLAPVVLAWFARSASRLRAVARLAFLASGPVFFGLMFLVFASRLGLGDASKAGQWSWKWCLPIMGIPVIWVWVFVNINTFSPHQYYRNRLCECYLAVFGSREKRQQPWIKNALRAFMRGKADQDGVTTLQQLPLTELGKNRAAPLHLINTTLNVEASSNRELRGRNGDFFLFSREYCGSPLTGYVATKDLQEEDPHIDLGTAMAISGAAASTNMGWKTLREFRFLMLLFNVRLGYWLRRPGLESKAWRVFRGPGPRYFLRELVGNLHEQGDYVNLSDGGHIENLAVYELLRRQTRFIVCTDAGMEPGMECSDLMRLQRYASIDLGIEMHFDLDDLQLLPNGNSSASAILVKIDYAPSKATADATSSELGWMVYFKLACTGAEPMHLQDYKRQNPAFPHQSTGDQIYDEAQFESYRALGAHAAESLFSQELNPNPESIEAWFQSLADNLLPDNDSAFGSPAAGVSARDESAAGAP